MLRPASRKLKPELKRRIDSVWPWQFAELGLKGTLLIAVVPVGVVMVVGVSWMIFGPEQLFRNATASRLGPEWTCIPQSVGADVCYKRVAPKPSE